MDEQCGLNAAKSHLAAVLVDEHIEYGDQPVVLRADQSFAQWEAFTGTPGDVLPTCEALLSQNALPAQWRIISQAHPDRADDLAAAALEDHQTTSGPRAPAPWLVGTVGGGCGEAEVIESAQRVLAGGTAERVRVDLTEDFTTWSPAVCGGVMDVFVERVEQ